MRPCQARSRSDSAAKPVVAQGDRGLSRKGPEPGNTSFHYSITRVPARRGWIAKWSTSALGSGIEGWGWFALRLDDGRELMFYLLRRRDRAVDPFSAGTLIAADGTTRALEAGDVRVETLAHWMSPRSGVRQPARWRLSVPSAALRLEIDPRLADQELIVGTRYWEGAVTVAGSSASGPIAGRGTSSWSATRSKVWGFPANSRTARDASESSEPWTYRLASTRAGPCSPHDRSERLSRLPALERRRWSSGRFGGHTYHGPAFQSPSACIRAAARRSACG